MLYFTGIDGGIFQIFFWIVFLMIAVTIVRNVMEWHRNNQSPQLSDPAMVTAKRTKTDHHNHTTTNANGVPMTTMNVSTTYYVTFEKKSGERVEFHVSGREYGMLAEGDRGILHFQGTRYLGFDRV